MRYARILTDAVWDEGRFLPLLKITEILKLKQAILLLVTVLKFVTNERSNELCL